MYLLVINCGSSSIKFTIFKEQNLTVVANGIVERIGEPGTTIHFRKINGKNFCRRIPLDRIQDAIDHIAHLLRDPGLGGIDAKQITAIGHRVVHGGETIHKPSLVDERVKQVIRSCFDLAPLHNPPNLNGIIACEKLFPWTQQAAVFDTAFHATLPPHAFLYGLPYDLYLKKKIRKYGFHGISNQYVSRKAAEFLEKESHEMIVCHLGNGSSITAIKDGESVDTSMGFTPLDGLIMGTRSGEIDPEIVLFLIKKHYSLEQLENILNKKSGLQGITGVSGDVRDLREASLSGNRMAQLALDMLAYRITLFIGSYITILHGLDALVFTGGIGENAWYIRKKVCEALEFAGLKLDSEKNKKNQTEISTQDSKIKVLVIPTNEELEIAKECVELEKRVVK